MSFDEVGFRLVPVYKRMWFFKGEKPKSLFWWSNKKLQVFAALEEGKKLYYEFHVAQNSLIFKAFLSNFIDRKSTRLNSSHIPLSRMPSSA